MKKAYEVAVEQFEEADKKYREFEDHFLSGMLLGELLSSSSKTEIIVEGFKAAIEDLKKLLEERNAKLTNAANAMRQAVQLSPSEWRGPTGKPTVVTSGRLVCSSVTKRTFDAESLIGLTEKQGMLDRLLSLASIDKNGKEYKLVEQKWDIDYENVLKWLQQNELTDILNGPYDEKESTPMVKGAKQLAFLGEDLK